MILRIINKSKENTFVLRQVVKQILRYEGINDNVEITFKNSHGGTTSGNAYYVPVRYTFNAPNSHKNIPKPRIEYKLGWHKSIRMKIPSNWKTEGLLYFIKVLKHELAHTRGIRHKDMLPIASMQIEYFEDIQRLVTKHN